MSFVPGRLRTSADGVAFEAERVALPLAGYAFASPPVDGQPVELGVRPEHVQQVAAGIAAPIEMVEPMGSDQLAWTRSAARRCRCGCRRKHPSRAGDTLSIAVPADRLNIFDAASGRRL